MVCQLTMPNVLAIFAKAPVVGQVKTRLCPPLSPTQATDLSRCFLLDTVERMCTFSQVQVSIAFTPADSESIFRALLPFPVRYLPQRGGSLGEREIQVFIDLLAEGFTRVVIIGSDIPTLPGEYVRQAFARLAETTCDVVLGPSDDGGYYLIGARAVHRELVEKISWSTAQVLAQTLAQARSHGLNVSLLPAWHDVDTKEDLQQLIVDLRSGNGDDAPRTRAFLESV